jgi:hypothetical protein
VQELKVRRETPARAVRADALDLQEVVAALVADANVAAWEQRLAETSERIERSGRSTSPRSMNSPSRANARRYLDRQFADLTDA